MAEGLQRPDHAAEKMGVAVVPIRDDRLVKQCEFQLKAPNMRK
jgi:hypothetical protein